MLGEVVADRHVLIRHGGRRSALRAKRAGAAAVAGDSVTGRGLGEKTASPVTR